MSDGDTTGTITRLWPRSDAGLSDDEIAQLYSVDDRSRPWVRVNFVASLDGSATHNGRSGGLGDAADRRVFDVLRRLCDVVVVGAGTVRAEGYGPMRLDAASTAWRRAHGLAEHPVFAIVSAELELDPASRIFRDAPVRPIVLTGSAAPAGPRAALAEVADVITCGTAGVDTALMLQRLAERGLPQVHCEGGPHLFGSMIAAGAVDELCLTLSAQLEAGLGPRISNGAQTDVPMHMRLAQVLAGGSTLLLRYVRG